MVGGHFQRLVGLFKNAFYKSIGNVTLSFPELEEVVLDVEVALNNRLLNYLEDDVQLPVLTLNSMLHSNPKHLPELHLHHVPDKDLSKKARYQSKCKDVVWNQWTEEYVRILREQLRRAGGEQTSHPKISDVVTIQGETKSRNHWKLGILTALIKGTAGIVRGAKSEQARVVWSIQLSNSILWNLRVSQDPIMC